MKVSVKLFGPLRMLTGKRQLSLNVKENCTVEELIALLTELYPRLADLVPESRETESESDLLVLRKAEILAYKQRLQEGDEVTIVTPISGG